MPVFAPETLLSFIAAMFLVEATPGPNMGYLAALSASQGRLAGLKAVAGITLGLAVYMLLAVFGITEIIAQLPAVYALLRWAGVLFLLYLAWEAWQDASETSPSRPDAGMSSPFWRGFLANVLNPKAAIFYVSLLPGFVSAERGALWAQALTLGLIHILISVLIHGGIVIAAARAGLWLQDSPAKVIFRRAMAIMIALIAVWLAWETR